jgi:hypothetical protein
MFLTLLINMGDVDPYESFEKPNTRWPIANDKKVSPLYLYLSVPL